MGQRYTLATMTDSLHSHNSNHRVKGFSQTRVSALS